MKIVLILVAFLVALTMIVLIFRKVGHKSRPKDGYTVKRVTYEAAVEYLKSSLDNSLEVHPSEPHKGVFTGENSVKHMISGEYRTGHNTNKTFSVEIEFALQNGHPVLIEMKNLEK